MSSDNQRTAEALLSGRVPDRPHTIFSALGDPRRVFIFHRLLKRGSACVSEVAQWCDFSISAASQQLSILERGGLLVRRREGQRICFEVNESNAKVRVLAKIIE